MCESPEVSNQLSLVDAKRKTMEMRSSRLSWFGFCSFHLTTIFNILFRLRVRMFGRNGSGKLPLHVVRDNAKWVFLPTKIIMSTCICWPQNRSKLLFWLQCFCVALSCFFLYGNIYYATHADSDIVVIVLLFTVFIVILEGIARYHMLMTKKEKLNNLLNTIYYEFWASNVVGDRVNNELLVDSRRIIFITCFITAAGVLCCLQYITNAVFFKHLPLLTTYSYNWQKSPYYELMLCFQSFFAVNIVIFVCANDFLVVSILSVCVAQFKLLKTYVRDKIAAAILDDRNSQTPNAMEMLRFALNHHKKLIKVSQDINDIFRYYILFQLLISIVTVCVSTFVITFLPQQRLSAVCYFLGNIMQIFIYCYMGSELLYESTDLSIHIFHCGWHLTTFDKDFQKSLILGMIHAQRPIEITAGGFGQLQLNTFLNIIKFSFSVYTLLQTLVEKQDRHI